MADGAVAPLTFQFAPTLVAQQGANANTSAPRLGIQGGGDARRNGGNAVMFSENLTAGPGIDGDLPGFISRAFAPKIEAQKQVKFAEGYAAAASGKAINDIKEEEPWYAKIFGPTPFAQGADMFAVQSAAGKMQQHLTEAMPELRKQSPEEFQRWYVEQMQGLQGQGDAFTQALVTKTFMDSAAPVMEMHTKQHFQYQQEMLAQGQYSAWVDQGNALNAMAVAAAKQGRDHPGQAPDPEQFALPLRTFLQSLQSPKGQTADSYAGSLVNTVETLAENGSWYTVRAIIGTGILKQLPPEKQDALNTKVEAARQRFKKRMTAEPSMVKELSLIGAMSNGAMSADAIVDRMLAFNETYKVLTGDDMGYYDIDDYVKNAESASEAYMRALERQADKNDRAAEKAQDANAKVVAEAQRDADLAIAVTSNSLGTYAAMNKVAADDVSRAFVAKLDAEPQNVPRYLSGNLSGHDPYIDPRYSKRLQAQVTNSTDAGEEWTAGFGAAHAQWKAIYDYSGEDGTSRAAGAATARAYYGNDLHDAMLKYDGMVTQGVDAQLAYRRVFGQEVSYAAGDIRGNTGAESKEISEAIAEAVNEVNPGFMARLAGSDTMGTSANATVTHVVGQWYERIVNNEPGISKKEAAASAVQIAKANGLEVAGRYAWQNMKGQKTVAQELGMTEDVFATYFDEALTARLRKQGMSVDDETAVTIIRIGNDKDGNARMGVTAYKDGTYKTVYITEPELRALRNKKYENDQARAAATEAAKAPAMRVTGGLGM